MDHHGHPWTVILNTEKRKVGGSTPPLTTRSDQAILPSTSGNVIFRLTWPLPINARPRPLKTAAGRPLVHVECTGP